MNSSPHDHVWEKQLKAGLGEAPAPDFGAWCMRNADALFTLKTMSAPHPHRNWRTGMKSLKWIAASLFLVVGVVLFRSEGTLSQNAFADSIPGVDNVQTITWTTTLYYRVTSADRQRTWLRLEQRLNAYRAPGQYRETRLDEAGQPNSVNVRDIRAGRMLELNLRDKKAFLKIPGAQPDAQGPFAWVGEALRERMVAKRLRVKSVSLQGQKLIDKTRANVVRVMIQNVDLEDVRQDFLFDMDSKRLVGIWNPNTNDFDPDTAPDRKNPAEEKWSMLTGMGSLEHEIVINPKLNPSDFGLDPPAGYAFKAIAKPTVTEEEMIAYLGAVARFSDNAFSDSQYAAFDQKKFNAISVDPANRTPAEKGLIDLRDKLMLREIYESPIKRFVDDQTEANSFQYVGSGVKLGHADKIVCWYRLRNTAKYRVVYGDLSVKEATAAELPLNLLK